MTTAPLPRSSESERISWADLSDDEECDRSCFAILPTSRRVLAQSTHRQALRPTAPEFFPALTATCNVVCVSLCESMAMAAAPSQPSWVCARHEAAPSRSMSSSSDSVPERAVRLEDARPPCRNDDCGEDFSEEQCRQREEARRRSIELVQQTREYRTLQRAMQAKSILVDEPVCPDPTDRSISKRQFKYLVTQWRKALAKLQIEDDDSEVSTYDSASASDSVSILESDFASALASESTLECDAFSASASDTVSAVESD